MTRKPRRSTRANPRSDIRNPKDLPPAGRTGDPVRTSDFGFRISALVLDMSVLAHLHRSPEGFDLLRGQEPGRSRREMAQRQRSDPEPVQVLAREAEPREDAPHFAVHALMDGDLDDGALAVPLLDEDPDGPRLAFRAPDAPAPPPQDLGDEPPLPPPLIRPGDRVAWVGEQICQVPVVGHDQQPLGL